MPFKTDRNLVPFMIDQQILCRLEDVKDSTYVVTELTRQLPKPVFVPNDTTKTLMDSNREYRAGLFISPYTLVENFPSTSDDEIGPAKAEYMLLVGLNTWKYPSY